MEPLFDIDEIIAKRLTGELDPNEGRWLEEWLQQSKHNQLYFNQMEKIWQTSLQARPILSRPLDVEAALRQTKLKIHGKHGGGSFRVAPRYWALAAAFILVLTAIWFMNTSPKAEIQLVAANNIRQDTLLDGSVVALNSRSSLQADFERKARRVRLRGEAYFQVAPQTEKPFTVQVQQALITVVGTRFNVDNRSDSTKIIVSVEEGKVKVQSGTEVIYLSIGEQAVVDCQSGAITRSILPKSGHIKGWLDRRFVFDDVPLTEVIPVLNDAYGVQIALKNQALGNCRLHARFNDEPIERVVELIAETFSLQIEARNGMMLLDGAGCSQ